MGITRQDQLLVIAGEESAEVIQELSKCLRFGPEEIYPPIGKTNADRVLDEFNDLVAVMEMLQAEGLFEQGLYDRGLIAAKKLKVERHMLYSSSLGRVTNEEKSIEANVTK